MISHSFWEQRGRIQVETTLQVPIYRGTIFDRSRRLLALSVPQRSLFADGKFLADPRKTALELSPILQEKPEGIQNKFARGQRFVWLKRNLCDQQAGGVAKLKLAGIHFLEEYKRFYPYRQIAGQVLGFVGFDGTGLEGVEKTYDEMLREGFQSLGQQRDGLRKRLACASQSPGASPQRPGLSLTLDAYVQYLAERELEEAVKRYNAKSGEVVRRYGQLHRFMQRHGMLTIFLLGAIPNPIFDVGGLIAGALRMKAWKFILAAWAGKTIRLSLTAWACQSGLPLLEQLFGQ